LFCSLQPIPQKREERPVSCFLPGLHSSPSSFPLKPALGILARDVALMARDKQRANVASMMISNETYGTTLDLNALGYGHNAPPPPPARGPAKGGFSWGGRTNGSGLGLGPSLYISMVVIVPLVGIRLKVPTRCECD
jgi:hypothetical protein